MEKLNLSFFFLPKRIFLLLIFSFFNHFINAQDPFRIGMSVSFSPTINYEQKNEYATGSGIGLSFETEIVHGNYIQQFYFIDYIESSFGEELEQSFEDVFVSGISGGYRFILPESKRMELTIAVGLESGFYKGEQDFFFSGLCGVGRGGVDVRVGSYVLLTSGFVFSREVYEYEKTKGIRGRSSFSLGFKLNSMAFIN